MPESTVCATSNHVESVQAIRNETRKFIADCAAERKARSIAQKSDLASGNAAIKSQVATLLSSNAACRGSLRESQQQQALELHLELDAARASRQESVRIQLDQHCAERAAAFSAYREAASASAEARVQHQRKAQADSLAMISQFANARVQAARQQASGLAAFVDLLQAEVSALQRATRVSVLDNAQERLRVALEMAESLRAFSANLSGEVTRLLDGFTGERALAARQQTAELSTFVDRLQAEVSSLKSAAQADLDANMQQRLRMADALAADLRAFTTTLSVAVTGLLADFGENRAQTAQQQSAVRAAFIDTLQAEVSELKNAARSSVSEKTGARLRMAAETTESLRAFTASLSAAVAELLQGFNRERAALNPAAIVSPPATRVAAAVHSSAPTSEAPAQAVAEIPPTREADAIQEEGMAQEEDSASLQAVLLAALENFPDGTTATTLSELVGSTPTIVGRVMRNLVKAGLARKDNQTKHYCRV